MKNLRIVLSLFAALVGATALAAPIDLNQVLDFAKTEMLLVDRLQAPEGDLKTGAVYDLSHRSTDWNQGYTTLFVGKRKEPTSQTAYLERLSHHIHQFDENMTIYGLNGYVAYLDENFEIAWLNWIDRASADRAYQSSAGQEIIQDASSFMDSAFFAEMNWKTKEVAKP